MLASKIKMEVEAMCVVQLQGTEILILVLFFNAIGKKDRKVTYILKACKAYYILKLTNV